MRRKCFYLLVICVVVVECAPERMRTLAHRTVLQRFARGLWFVWPVYCQERVAVCAAGTGAFEANQPAKL